MKYRNNINLRGKANTQTDKLTEIKQKVKKRNKAKEPKNMLKHPEPGHRNVTQDLTVSK